MAAYETNLKREITLKIEQRKTIIMLQQFIQRYFNSFQY